MTEELSQLINQTVNPKDSKKGQWQPNKLQKNTSPKSAPVRIESIIFKPEISNFLYFRISHRNKSVHFWMSDQAEFDGYLVVSYFAEDSKKEKAKKTTFFQSLIVADSLASAPPTNVNCDENKVNQYPTIIQALIGKPGSSASAAVKSLVTDDDSVYRQIQSTAKTWWDGHPIKPRLGGFIKLGQRMEELNKGNKIPLMPATSDLIEMERLLPDAMGQVGALHAALHACQGLGRKLTNGLNQAKAQGSAFSKLISVLQNWMKEIEENQLVIQGNPLFAGREQCLMRSYEKIFSALTADDGNGKRVLLTEAVENCHKRPNIIERLFQKGESKSR